MKGKLINHNEKKEVILKEEVTQDQKKIFEKFSLDEIVFLAITSAVLIATCAIMPLVSELTKVIFGIAQLVTSFQLSFFCSVGLMKVKKTFSLTIILLFMSAIMFPMAFAMGLSNIFVAFTIEILMMIFFKGYHKKSSCFIASACVAPFSLIVPSIYNKITAPEIFEKTVSNGYLVCAMVVLVVFVGLLGSFLGVKVSEELEKAGVLKRKRKEKLNEKSKK